MSASEKSLIFAENISGREYMRMTVSYVCPVGALGFEEMKKDVNEMLVLAGYCPTADFHGYQQKSSIGLYDRGNYRRSEFWWPFCNHYLLNVDLSPWTCGDFEVWQVLISRTYYQEWDASSLKGYFRKRENVREYRRLAELFAGNNKLHRHPLDFRCIKEEDDVEEE